MDTVRRVLVEFLLPFIVSCMLTLFTILIINTIAGIFLSSVMREHECLTLFAELIILALVMSSFFLYFQKIAVKFYGKCTKRDPTL